MSVNYSGINYSKLIELLEEFEFPYNDTLIEILYKFDNDDNLEYTFYYKRENELIKDIVYKVLTFSKYSQYNIVKTMNDINIDIEGEFFPFIITEEGNYVGLFVSELGEETIRLYHSETQELCSVHNANEEDLTLEDFLNGL